MTRPFPTKNLRFFLTAPSPCPYLPGKRERKVFTALDGLEAANLHDVLTHAGFRRSQNIAYRPSCDGCEACISARVPVARFTFARRWRKILAKNADLTRSLRTAEATEEQADFAETGFDLQAGMCGRSEIRDEVGNATAVDWCVSVPYWRDEFNEALGEDWYWVNENADRWNLTENLGFLRIYTSPYGTGGENLVLRPLAQGDFMIKTHRLFEPNTNFQFAGLVIWQDESNFLQFGRAFCDIEGPCVGNGIYFDRVIGGSGFDSPNFATPVDSLDEAYLRVERREEMVKAFFSYDGTSWFEIGTHWIPSDFQVKGVGLTSSQDFSEVSVPAIAHERRQQHATRAHRRRPPARRSIPAADRRAHRAG